MNLYEKRFYEDIHKLVLIQKEILKELKKMNEPLQEDRETQPINFNKILTPEELDKEWEKMLNDK